MKSSVVAVAVAGLMLSVWIVPAAATDFEDLTLGAESFYNGAVVFEDLALSAESFYNGSDGAGDWRSNGVKFSNHYDSLYSSWDGFAYSNVTDNTTAGFGNQYSAFPGAGQGATENYAVGYASSFAAGPPTVTLPESGKLAGVYVANSTYAYLSMRDGDDFSKKFGGSTGDDPDWFLLTITGKDEAGAQTGTVEFYLADYRFSDNSRDYIVDAWTWVDLSSLGEVEALEFTLSSSDVGDWGMNTPAFFCLDTLSIGNDWHSGGLTFGNNFDAVYSSWDGFAYSNKTDNTTAGFGNQYSAFPGTGQGATENYAVGYASSFAAGPPTVTLPESKDVAGVYVANSTYAYLSMRDGDDFSKKFGGSTGDDPDWFLLTITGKDEAGAQTGAVEFYLADYRFADNSRDYIVDAWTWVDLSGLGAVRTLTFALSSSDTGQYGMNTPAFFCLDTLTVDAGSVSGTVTTAKPILGYIAPIQGATVTLTGSGGDTHTASSSASGQFSFDSLPAGVYTMSVEADGFDTATADDVQISLDGGLPSLDAALSLDMSVAGDASGNDRVGIEDAVIILQTLTGARQP